MASPSAPPSADSAGPARKPPTVGWARYRRLLRYARPDARGWVLLALLTLVSGGIALLQPWPVQVLVDHVLSAKAMPGWLRGLADALPGAGTAAGLVAWIVVAGLVIFAVGSLVEVLVTRAWIAVGQRTVYRLAADLLARLERRSLAFHSRASVGDSLSRITGDAWCVHRLVDTLFFTPKQAIAMLAGILVVMAQMDPGLTLLALAAAPLMAWSSFLFGKPLRRAARRRRELESRIQSHVQQTLSGLSVVQVFGQEDRQQRRFEEIAEDAVRAQRRGTWLGSLSSLVSGLAITLGAGLVLWVGASHVLDGRLTVGRLLVFLAYLRPLQGQLAALTKIYPGLQEAGASVDRVSEVLEAEPEILDAPDAVPLDGVRGEIRWENVTYGYDRERPVLRDVSAVVAPGQTVALVGTTGAGKTTLAGLVPRFADPWEGRVLVDGKDVRSVTLRSLRERVAVLFQEPFLFAGTVAENIAYGRPDAPRAEIEKAARDAQLDEVIARLPEGYDTALGQRGATLSGGERQRLAVARAFLRNAPILILDEPTSALDAETERSLLEALAALMRGRTTLVIAHRLSTVRRADRILVLEDGGVVESGTHDDLVRRDGPYARLWRLQSPDAADVS